MVYGFSRVKRDCLGIERLRLVEIEAVTSRPVEGLAGDARESLQVDVAGFQELDVLFGKVFPDHGHQRDIREKTG